MGKMTLFPKTTVTTNATVNIVSGALQQMRKDLSNLKYKDVVLQNK